MQVLLGSKSLLDDSQFEMSTAQLVHLQWGHLDYAQMALTRTAHFHKIMQTLCYTVARVRSVVPASHRNNPTGVIHHFCENLLEHPLVIVSSDSNDDDGESEHNLEKCIFVFMRNIASASLLPASLSPLRSQCRSDEWGMRCLWFITQDNIWEVSGIFFTHELQLLMRAWFQGLNETALTKRGNGNVRERNIKYMSSISSLDCNFFLIFSFFLLCSQKIKCEFSGRWEYRDVTDMA